MQSTSNHKKRQNPRVDANPISVIFFLHLIPIIWKNSKKKLKGDDLFDVLKEHKTSILGDKLEDVWNVIHKTRQKYALHFALWKMFYKEIIAIGILQGLKEISLLIVLPYAVGKLVSYFGNHTNVISKNAAYMFAALITLTFFIDRVFSHQLWMWTKHVCMKMRVCCCSLVYRKTLRLSLNALHQTNIGHIINLLSNDVGRFDSGFILFHYVWSAPLQAAVATYILYCIIGVPAFSGMMFILLVVPLQIYMGKLNSAVRLKVAHRTDERVRLMNEILAGIQIIKMYTWEKSFAKLIAFVRRLEMKSILLHFFIESLTFSLLTFVTRTSIFITIVVYLVLGYSIDADITYSVTAIYNVIRPNITILFSLALSSLGEVHISILRLEEFLRFEEVHLEKCKDNAILPNDCDTIKDVPKVPKVFLENVSVKWSAASSNNTLSDINLRIDDKQLVAIIGPVGSGKSTLLNVLLNELPFTNGTIKVAGRISYASQESWLFLGSVRQNILFGDAFDTIRYDTVVKVCALESDFKLFPHGDGTIVRDKGKSLSGGQKARISLARCIYKQADIYLLDDPLSAVDTKVGKQLYDECIKEFLKDKLCILVTHQLQYVKNADKIVILDNGMIVASGSYNELQNSSINFATLLKEVNSEEKQDASFTKSCTSLEKIESTCDDEDEDIDEDEETVATGTIGITTYKDYFKHGGSWFVISCIMLLFLVTHSVASAGDYFVSYWINSEQEASKAQNSSEVISRTNVIYIYSGLIGCTILLSLAHSTVLFLFFVQASKKMHNVIFEKIVHSTMYFFNHNPAGRILNRFSKDMGIVDEYIPFILVDTFDIIIVFATIIILSCIVNYWFVFPCAVLVLFLCLFRSVFMKTSRQVKRIEATTRSSMYNQAAASVNGLTTIRAFNAQEILIKEYDNIQDNHNSAWYLYISSSEAFGLFIDMVCVSFITVIIFSFLLINKDYHGGDVGLLVTLYIAIAGMVQWGIFQLTELENNMTSVERILEYTKLETEPKRLPISNLPKDWPEFGRVMFDNVSMQYETNGATVLKNLNFVINPGENIGIVGRTGAGKTSTISALFQFYPLSGSIIIDGVDTTKLPLEVLRSKISIIPQECVLFSGTMRKNLDPFEEYNDDILWDALDQVELKNILEEIPGGLNAHITESGSNFSTGQRQLICLARAIIRNNKIILMDEATANIDSYTDALIQKTIKKNFAHCTIITVAHRLYTIMDCDKVLVMDKGQVIEFDVPYILLQKENGVFQNMVETTGSITAKSLYSIAEENYTLKLNAAKCTSEQQGKDR